MRDIVVRRETCRLCGSRDIHPCLTLKPTPIVDAYVPGSRLLEVQEPYPLELRLCRSCGHVQLTHIIDPDVVYPDYIYTTGSSPDLTSHFRVYAGEVWDNFSSARREKGVRWFLRRALEKLIHTALRWVYGPNVRIVMSAAAVGPLGSSEKNE